MYTYLISFKEIYYKIYFMKYKSWMKNAPGGKNTGKGLFDIFLSSSDIHKCLYI